MAAPIILCDCAGMDEKRWLECREHGPKGDIEYTVGGSDVATIFGLSPWTSPLELWMIKKGRMKPKTKPNPLQLEMGHLLEPIAAHFYAQRTGDTVIDDTNMYQHADFPYALADIDRRIIRKADGEQGVLECKSCTYHKAVDWADGAYPLYYEFQLRYYLAVMDMNFGAFSALWGNNPDNDLATPGLIRSQAKEDIIFERLDQWIWSLRHDKPPTMERMKVDMTGRWKKDAKYGLQFMMESYEEVIDPGKNGIVSYLSSGLIRGIGKRLAERIYNTFGDNTLAILDNDPDRIQEVPGISGKRSAQLRDSYLETRGARRIITLLAPLDINAGQAVRLQKELGIRAEELLKEHPYEVFERGLLSFDAADRLAERQGIPRTAPERVAAGLLHTLELAEQKGQLDTDLVLVDEVSMLDMKMTWYLFHALPPMCRLVLVGDADQLPSVGPSAVLSELIRCGRIPMAMLDKVFRQSEGSMIAENARRIRHGEKALQFDGDFQFWPSADIKQSAQWLERLYMQEVARYGVDNVALLTPFRAKTETGVRAMNERLRGLVNPPSASKQELVMGQRVFRLGDKVMQTKNREEVINGDIGYIRKIDRDDDGFLVEVDFHDGRVVSYEDSESLSHLDLAYATTIHKSQGGQYDSVLLSIQNLHGRMLKRPLVYTGLTRAKRRAQIVGDWQAVIRAIQTTDTERRNTLLSARITQTET